jgi:oligopeptide/dipeptide ABC transporter ATP-binding protein
MFPASSSAVLRIEGLKTQFSTRAGVVNVLDGVDLKVDRGETVGIVGESGSGKTMTALSIMRLIPHPAGRIVEGSIWFEGTDLVRLSQEEMTSIRGRRIAMIPQDPMTSLNPVFTVGNQLLESINLVDRRPKDEAFSRARHLLTSVKIADPERRMSSYPHEMSGGMRQRVVGAIALAGTPSLIIADEPTTSLDATVQLQYLQLLQQIQRDTGAAIVFITHDFGVVAEICDRVAVMYAGRIVEHASVRELFESPQHPYTRALIDSLPDVNSQVEFLPTIKGQPPDLASLPSGCSFAPRCPFAFDRCEDFPPAFDVTDEHSARCWLLEGKSHTSGPQ